MALITKICREKKKINHKLAYIYFSYRTGQSVVVHTFSYKVDVLLQKDFVC